MPSYFTRLLLLASASFLLVQVVAGALAAWSAPAAIRRAGTMRPQRAARFLFTLRLLPVALSAMVVAALCIPSYLRFEPRVVEEEVGAVCLAAAILGASICAWALYRTIGALIRSSLYVKRSQGVETRVEGETVWVVQESAGLALAGILRPRLMISERALRELSSDQLAVALRHEHAHWSSRDNLKRLLLLLAPPIFPGLRTLQRAWVRCAEWAADDRAASGNVDQSVALAGALVRVARLQSGIAMPPLVTSLVEAEEDLSLRVERLLRAAPMAEPAFRGGAIALAATALLITAVAVNPASQRIVHQLLEMLLD